MKCNVIFQFDLEELRKRETKDMKNDVSNWRNLTFLLSTLDILIWNKMKFIFLISFWQLSFEGKNIL